MIVYIRRMIVEGTRLSRPLESVTEVIAVGKLVEIVVVAILLFQRLGSKEALDQHLMEGNNAFSDFPQSHVVIYVISHVPRKKDDFGKREVDQSRVFFLQASDEVGDCGLHLQQLEKANRISD